MKDLIKKLSKFNILYIEDDPIVMEQTLYCFNDLFSNIDTAVDGEEGLKKYKSFLKKNNSCYDIIISDVNMPNMDGITLSKEIFKICDTQEILIISAYNESKTLEKILNTGISTFIHKPIKFELLIDSLEKILKRIEITTNIKKNQNTYIELNDSLNSIADGFDKVSIATRTDLDGIITYASEGFVKISGYSKDELIGQNHNIIRSPDMPKSVFKKMWATIQSGQIFQGRIKNLKKDGGFYWVNATIAPYFDKNNNIIGYNALREDITLQVESENILEKVNLLLNNINDGYLLFNEKLEIEHGYSSKCLKIFNYNNINNKDISKLLFSKVKDIELFKKAMTSIFNTTHSDKKEIYLSLLPSISIINKRHISITYKIVNNTTILLILKDITNEIELKSKIDDTKNEHDIIISIVTNIKSFLDLTDSFKDFMNNIYISDKTIKIDRNINNMLLKLHTYKGLCGQFHLKNTSLSLHELETLILSLDTNTNSITFSNKDDIKNNFYIDLDIIEKILGVNFLAQQEYIHKVTFKNLKNIREELTQIIIEPENISFKIQNIVAKIDLINSISLGDILLSHKEIILDLGRTLNKSICVEIVNTQDIPLHRKHQYLFDIFIHLYRNIVDHGIESKNIRILRNKPVEALVSIDYKYENNILTLKIKDDGNGIDTNKIIEKAIQNKLISKEESLNLTQKEKIDMIFCDKLSSANTATTISGRGIGMAAIKNVINSFNGEIIVNSQIDKGVEFIFNIPIDQLQLPKTIKKDEESLVELSDIIMMNIKKFCINTLKTNIITSDYFNDLNISNHIHVTIDIENNKNKTISISLDFNDKIIDKFISIYLTDLESSIEKEMLREESLKEIANIVIGLSMQDFSKEEIWSLCIPKIISKNDLEKRFKDKTNKIINVKAITGLGKATCRIIQQKGRIKYENK